MCSELEIITHVIDKQTPKHFSLESKLMLLLHECGLFINPSFFFFIEEGERIKTLDQKRNMQFERDLIGVVLCLLSTCI